MAQQPTSVLPSVGPGGGPGLPGRSPMAFQQAGLAGTAEGQGAAVGGALRNLGQDLQGVAQLARQEALAEMSLQNEAMATEADTFASETFSKIYTDYASLEGKAAVSAQQATLDKLRAAREAALAEMPNPAARGMLDRAVSRRLGFYAESVGRYAASQNRKWLEGAAVGAARGAVDQASVFRNVPDLVNSVLEAGAGQIVKQGELNGWDKDTLDANIRQYRGGAYRTIIQQLVGDGKVDEALAMFNDQRDRMDAGSAAQIAQSLAPVVQRRQDQQRVAGFMSSTDVQPQQRDRARAVTSGLIARGLAPHIATAFAANAIAESGANPATPPGDNGASDGLFQWRDSRRAEFKARYGVDPSKATLDQQLDFMVSELDTTEARAGEAIRRAPDAQTAAGLVSKLFLRPANTEAEMRKRSAIAASLERDGAFERPDFDGAKARAREAAGGDFEAEQRWVSMINARENAFNATTTAERTVLTNNLRDVEAALADGRPVAVPEDRIRALFPKAQADEIVARLTDVREQGEATQAVRFASPGDYANLLGQYADVGAGPGEQVEGETPPGYARRSKARSNLVTAWQRTRDALKADPAVYVSQSPALAAMATPEALAEEGGLARYVNASLAEQARLGVPEAERRAMSKERAATVVQSLVTLDPKEMSVVPALAALEQQYGAAWPSVWGDLVRNGLSDAYVVLGSMTHPDQVGVRGDAQRMMSMVAEKGGEAALRDALVRTSAAGSGNPAKLIDDALPGALAPFLETVRLSGGQELFNKVEGFVRNLAYFYAFQGADPNRAVQHAVNGVLNARYDFLSTMRVPKGAGPLASEVARNVQADLVAEAVKGVTAGDPLEAEKNARLLDVAQSGFWVTNANDDGIVLYGNYKNMNAGGIPIRQPIKKPDGTNIKIKFEDMQAMRDVQRLRPRDPGVMPGLTQALERAPAMPPAAQE